MFIVPLVVNVMIICFIGAELVAVYLGKATINQLLVGCALSGVLALISFKLSREARLHANTIRDAHASLNEPKSSDK